MPVRIHTTSVNAPVAPLVTRGFGKTKFMVVTAGYGPVVKFVTQVIRFVRGGKTSIKNIYGQKIDEFNIAVSLAAINGKDLLKPIINKGKMIVSESDESVSIVNLNLKKRNEKVLTNIFAKLLNVKRGSDEHN